MRIISLFFAALAMLILLPAIILGGLANGAWLSPVYLIKSFVEHAKSGEPFGL